MLHTWWNWQKVTSILGGMFFLKDMFHIHETLPSRNCFQSLCPRTRRLVPLCSLVVSCSLALWAFRDPDCKRGEHLLFYYVIMGTDVYIKLLLFLMLSSTRWFRPWILLFVTVLIYLSSSSSAPGSELYSTAEHAYPNLSFPNFLIILLTIYYFFSARGGKVNQK